MLDLSRSSEQGSDPTAPGVHQQPVQDRRREEGSPVSPTQRTGLRSAAATGHARALGIGAYRPSRIVPNAEIVDAIDSSDEWIQQRSGIRSRRWAEPHETVQMMSVAAAREAIAHAGIAAGQIDAVVVATVSHMLQTPAVAPA